MEMTPNRKNIDLPQKRQGRLECALEGLMLKFKQFKLLKIIPGASHKLSTGLKAKRYYT